VAPLLLPLPEVAELELELAPLEEPVPPSPSAPLLLLPPLEVPAPLDEPEVPVVEPPLPVAEKQPAAATSAETATACRERKFTVSPTYAEGCRAP
jgi:hypothetical protein